MRGSTIKYQRTRYSSFLTASPEIAGPERINGETGINGIMRSGRGLREKLGRKRNRSSATCAKDGNHQSETAVETQDRLFEMASCGVEGHAPRHWCYMHCGVKLFQWWADSRYSSPVREPVNKSGAARFEPPQSNNKLSA